MPAYVLPPLEGRDVTAASSPGRWTRLDSLEKLALDLKVGGAQRGRDQIRSVPDTWAQALLAGQALADSRHELHAALTAQWRALIATVALQRAYGDVYRLSVARVPTGGGPLRALLLGPLAPVRSADDAIQWPSGVAIVSIAEVRDGRVGPDRPMALAVPDILIAPGRPFESVGIAGAPWLADGPIDPTRAALSADALRLLRDFAAGLAGHVAGLRATGRNQATQKALIDALEALAADCGGGLDEAADLRADPTTLGWPGPAGMALEAVRAIDIARLDGRSDCALRTRSDLPASFRSIILADPAIAATLGRPASAVRLYNQYMLSDAEARLPAIKREAADAGHLVLGVEDALSDALARLQDGSIAANAPGAAAALLPIAPALLLVEGALALARAAILEDRGGAVLAGVEVPLRSGGTHRLVKSYPRDHVLMVERLDDLGVWPNFASRSWRHYELRAQFRPRAELEVAVAASGAVMARDLADADPTGRSGRRGERVARWATPAIVDVADGQRTLGSGDARSTWFPFDLPSDGSNRGVQAWSNHPFEAIFLRFGGKAVGCVTPRLVEVVPDEAREAVVAIDFGTSNTIVRIERPGDGRSAADFTGRVLHPIAATDGVQHDMNQRRGAADWMPVGAQRMPFPTIIKTRTAVTAVDEAIRGVDETIYFADPDLAETADRQMDWIRAGLLKVDIKWDESAQGRRRTVRFLSQLLLMTAAELAAEGVPAEHIRWRFSYPNAFTPEQRSDLLRAMTTAWQRLTGGGEPGEALRMFPEGEAAMQSLIRDGQVSNAGNLVVLLDIGGGTTDVAIWHGTRTLWHGSFRLAAREFFTEPLARHPDILDAAMNGLDPAIARQLRQWAQGADDGLPRARSLVELTINAAAFNEGFRRQLPIHAKEASWRVLEEAASVALGGMLWHVGRLLRARAADWNLTAADLREVTVALGGRGSMYFTHLDPTKSDRLPRLMRMLTRAIGVDATPGIYFSPTPKQEVVDGLLRIESERSGDPPDTAMILGEAVTLHDAREATTFGAADRLDRVPAQMASPDVDLAEMREFLAALKDSAGIAIDLGRKHDDARLEVLLKSAIKKRLNDPARPLDAPLFIVALKRLVNELAAG